jgi:hypothetical protein
LQAHLAWHDPVPEGGLGHRSTEEVVDQQISPFALSLFNILNFKLLVKISPQSQPLQDGFLYP